MNRLQAAMKESAPRRQAYKLAQVGYKIGSYFKGCHNCGETDMVETASGKEKKVYRSGYFVYRAYVPSRVGWSYWCYVCGAKDDLAWEDAADIGEEAVRGTRDAIADIKKARRGEIGQTDHIREQLREVEERLRVLLSK